MRRKQAGDARGRPRPRAPLLVLRMRCAGASMGRATAPGARIAPAEDGRHAACTKPRRGTSHAAPARVMPGGKPPRGPPPPGGQGSRAVAPVRTGHARHGHQARARFLANRGTSRRACRPERAWPRIQQCRRAGVPLPHAAPAWGAYVRPGATAGLAGGHSGPPWPGPAPGRCTPPRHPPTDRIHHGERGCSSHVAPPQPLGSTRRAHGR